MVWLEKENLVGLEHMEPGRLLGWVKGRLQGMGAEFVCHPRGENIQLGPSAGLSTYLLVGFRQIVLYLRFLFSFKVGNLPTLKNCGMKQLFKKHCPLRGCTFSLSSPQCGTHN